MGPLRRLLEPASRARNIAAGAAVRALDLLYPGYCRECRAATVGNEPFCPRCAASVRWISSQCERCGLPVVHPGPAGCGSCAGRLLHFDGAGAAAEYLGPWRTAVLRFKFLGDQGLRGLLVEALEELYRRRFLREGPEALVPVPGHPWRVLLRGRDHVEELARDLSARIGLPVRPLLRRARWISSQTSLPRARRLVNPRGAFAARRPLLRRGAALPRRVLLLDDVLTTGATASECARALKGAGVEAVMAAAAARSPE